MFSLARLKKVMILVTLPGVIAFVIGALPIVLMPLEAHLFGDTVRLLPFGFEAASVRGFLGTIASGAMSALTLSYSLMLVVFTLAASTIGPRLLRRFTVNPVTQITAGLFGGTFLYALSALILIEENRIPALVVSGAGLLAIISVAMLIVFVREVSSSVSIDDEIAMISKAVLKRTETMAQRLKRCEWGERKLPDMALCAKAAASGYVGLVDEEGLVARAGERDAIIIVLRPQGSFVIQGEPLIAISGSGIRPEDEKEVAALESMLLDHVTLSQTREDDGTIDFSMKLLVEIALRALSPGINDTFTALAAVDSLTNILARLDANDLYGAGRLDEEGKVRLIRSDGEIGALTGRVLHPIRRAARGNIMMAQGLATALQRLHIVADKALKAAVRHHGQMMLEQIERENWPESDRRSVSERMEFLQTTT